MNAPRIEPRVRILQEVRRIDRQLGFPRLVLALGVSLVATSVALYGARLGTSLARVASAAGLALGFALSIVLVVVAARRAGRLGAGLVRWLRPLEVASRSRVERALGLYEASVEGRAPPETSRELAELHLNRLLDGLPTRELGRHHRARSKRVFRIGLVLLAGVGFFFSARGLEIVEGGLVLVARRGVAPFTIPYVEDALVTYEPPPYLDGRSSVLTFGSEIRLPEGSTVVFRIVPRESGRTLVLRDGLREVPFVSEGDGSFVARLVATDPADFRVAARFGDVVVDDSFDRRILPEKDQRPTVVLEGAPSTRSLADFDRLELEFLAYDDHGLTDIVVTMESGNESKRIDIARLDGKQQRYRGGHAVSRSDPFLERAFLPVRVRVEARDANPGEGAVWGKSEILTLVPPPLGSEAAARYRALAEVRSALVRVLGVELETARAAPAARTLETARAIEEASKRLDEVETSLSDRPDTPRASLRFLRAQIESLASSSGKSSTEAVVLAVDALLGRFSESEAVRVSNELASAVDEFAISARAARSAEARDVDRLLADRLAVVQAGGRELAALGVLGRDLGGVAAADLGRAEKALGERSYERAERIARHLAERLRRANPSFGAKGSGGSPSGSGSGGVESGAPSAGGEGSGAPPSSAPDEYRELERSVDELAGDHARGLGELDRLLEEARRALSEDLGRAGKTADAAERLRKALAPLPSVGGEPGTPSSEAALGKNQGEAMADALEAGDLGRARERGEAARAALERALDRAKESGSLASPEELEAARGALDRALEVAKRADSEAGRADRGRLNGLAQKERDRAVRARELARGRDGGPSLPRASRSALERASELMDRSAAALEQGRADEGRALSEKAQGELERALPGGDERESEAESDDTGEGRKQSRRGDVPERDEGERARRFRERVQKGLGRASGSLAAAVQRYAEELQ